MTGLSHVTLVIGGAASGKSAFAESVARSYPGNRTYIATAQAFDDEMRAKIAAHKKQRAGDGWDTLEVERDLAAALAGFGKDDVILIDCLTLWLTSLIMADIDMPAHRDALIDALRNADHSIVLVTNEVGQGIVPENALSRKFRQEQGLLNRQIAAEAGRVVQVTAGLPLVLKGTFPEGLA